MNRGNRREYLPTVISCRSRGGCSACRGGGAAGCGRVMLVLVVLELLPSMLVVLAVLLMLLVSGAVLLMLELVELVLVAMAMLPVVVGWCW